MTRLPPPRPPQRNHVAKTQASGLALKSPFPLFTSPQRQEEEIKRQARARAKAVILKAQGGTCLDDETLSVLLDMWDSGELRGGAGGLGAGLQGCSNGMFYGYLSLANAPAPRRPRSVEDDESPWSLGEPRREYSRKRVRACIAAGLPVILEGDAPAKSVMGAVGRQALDAGITKLGNLGGRYAVSMFELNRTFVEGWAQGRVGPGMLASSFGRSSTWTIQNFEVCRKD